MTSLTVQDRRGHRRLVITPSTLAVVALTSGSIAVAVACLLRTDHRGPAWLALVVAYLALMALALPDGWAGLATLSAYGIWWLFAVQDPTTPWALPAALSLLTFHMAVAHHASGPAGITAGRATMRTACRDGVLVAGFTALAAVVVVFGHDLTSTAPSIVGLTLLLLVLVPWIASRATEPPTGDQSE
jgi:uncharacterized protein (DUF983 family)